MRAYILRGKVRCERRDEVAAKPSTIAREMRPPPNCLWRGPVWIMIVKYLVGIQNSSQSFEDYQTEKNSLVALFYTAAPPSRKAGSYRFLSQPSKPLNLRSCESINLILFNRISLSHLWSLSYFSRFSLSLLPFSILYFANCWHCSFSSTHYEYTAAWLHW